MKRIGVLPIVGLFLIAGTAALFLPTDVAAFHVRVPLAIVAFVIAVGLAFFDQTHVRALKLRRRGVERPRELHAARVRASRSSRTSGHVREERPGWR